MDAVRVALLREVLDGTEWPRAARAFGGTLRTAVQRGPGPLLLVGTDAYEPWHLAAHLDDEAAWSGVPELSPTLLRFRVPPGAPPHLAVGLRRLAAAGRGETVLLVAPDRPGAGILERVHDARRSGATVLALSASAEGHSFDGVAHDVLSLPSPDAPALSLDVLQHLVSSAAGEATAPRRPPFRDPLSRLADHLSTPPPRW
ncbi:hypothetical protein ACIO6U_02110 [Streptomyces sp. NPDC087422]|uniref:hypothetical protein n=1 Tax=Streptomyces sp. NPDC087422 TaxID=3365786 RepID=UPI00381D5F46